MRKPPIAYWLALSIPALAIVYLYVAKAYGDQAYLAPAETAQVTRTCSFAGQTPKNVSVTGTSAATSTTVARGNIRVVCSTLSYMNQGAYGSTGATATTSSHRIPADSPEYFYNPGNNYIGFIRDTTSGTCSVSECK